MARLGPSLDAILSDHNYPPALEKLLAEALVLTALLGALLKDPGGQLTVQAQTKEGIVDLHRHKRDLADSLLEGTEMAARMSPGDMLQMLKAGLGR